MKTVFTCFAFLSALINLNAFALSISPGERHHFEEQYETWVKSLVQTVTPNNAATVISEINFSSNPNDIESAQELRELQELNHLPGLPNVVDTQGDTAIENPLYALVSEKKIKLIFDYPITENEKSLLSQVLTSKLKISSKDRLIIESQTTFNKKSNPYTLAISLLGLIFVLAVGISVVAGHLISNSQENNNEENSQNTNPTRPLIADGAELETHTYKAPSKQICQVIQETTPEELAVAIAHSSVGYARLVLNAAKPKQKLALKDFYQNQNAKQITRDESNLAKARLLEKMNQMANKGTRYEEQKYQNTNV